MATTLVSYYQNLGRLTADFLGLNLGKYQGKPVTSQPTGL